MDADEIVKEWRTGCTHYGPRGVEGTRHRYVGGCEECTDGMVAALLRTHRELADWKAAWEAGGQPTVDKILDERGETTQLVRELESEVSKMRNAILYYRDHPGCNPSSRRHQMRRLLWAAGEDSP